MAWKIIGEADLEKEGLKPFSMVKFDADVAIIVPILNEEATIVPLLESFEKLTLFPKEIILVDGGSTDHTVEVMSRYLDEKKLPYAVQLMILSHALPGRGRNEGIRKTQCPLIACTDAGGYVDPSWLEDLISPFRSNPNCEMVIGNCKSHHTKNFFERCTFYVTIESPPRKQFIFLGGASIAFRRRLWEKVKGYPEHLYPCEDKAFLTKIKKRGFPVILSDRAVVYWKSRSTLWAFFKQYFLYGRGDGEGAFVRHRYLLRILFYAALLVFSMEGKGPIAMTLLVGYLFLLSFKGWGTLKDLRVFLYLPLLFFVKDFSQLLGYFVGNFRRRHETY